MKINTEDFKINQSNSNVTEEVQYYTTKGLENYLDDKENPRLESDGPQVFAKAIKNKKSKHFTKDKPIGYSFYIKTDPNRKIYDPRVLHTIEPKIQKSFLNKTCKADLVFTEVTENIFNTYVNFLRTGNQLLLTKAQREIK